MVRDPQILKKRWFENFLGYLHSFMNC